MPTNYATTAVDVRSLIESAIAENAPLVMLYNTGDTEQRARVVWPAKILTNKQGHVYFRAHDSLRDTTRSFRLARVLAAHLLQA
jgi:predicted DNA-binding transcriptional regulator YafY